MTRAGAGKALTTKRTQAQRTQDAFIEAMSLRKLDESQLTPAGSRRHPGL